MGVIASFLEFNDNIGPLTDKLYAVLPAGVEIRIPSQINLLINIFFPCLTCKDAVCLVCLNSEISFIAIAVKNFPDFLTLSFVKEKL